jgi:hypothetical protein
VPVSTRIVIVSGLSFLLACLQGCSSCANQARIGQNGDAGADGGADGGGTTTDGGTTHSNGPGDFVLDGGPNGTGDGVTYGPDGGIILSNNSTALHFAWIANATAGTVSKFDTQTGNEVARYYSVIPIDGLGRTDGGVTFLTTNQANSPSRTAIDLNGDVWVANRAPGAQGSVTKIANDLASCRRLPDGGLNTSFDRNGNGVIETDPAAGEFITPSNPSDPTQYDSCVLFSTPVGSNGGGGGAVKARALAVSQGGLESGNSAGDIWVGIHSDSLVQKLESRTGQIIPVGPDAGTAITLPWGPYGAAVDGQQRLWLVQQTVANLALVDTRTGRLIAGNLPYNGPGTSGAYGIAIDGRDRVWVPSWTAGPSAFRYDHGPGLDAGEGTWSRFDFPNARSQTGSSLGDGRGIAADDQGYIWMSTHETANGGTTQVAQLIGFNADDGGIFRFQLPGGGMADFIDATRPADTYTSIGVGLDSNNDIWVNNFSGNAMRISRDGGTILRTASQAGNLYTYSDFTGYQLLHFTAPRGTFQRDYTGNCLHAVWGPISWTGTTPPNTSIQLFVKVADTAADLNNTGLPQYGPFNTSPADLQAAGVPPAHYLRVLFILRSTDHQSTPVLTSFTVPEYCPIG